MTSSSGGSGVNSDSDGFLIGQRRAAMIESQRLLTELGDVSSNPKIQEVIDKLSQMTVVVEGGNPLTGEETIQMTRELLDLSGDITQLRQMVNARDIANLEDLLNQRPPDEEEESTGEGSTRTDVRIPEVESRGVDPVVDAMHEMSDLVSPLKSLFGRSDEVPKEQRKHNKFEIKWLKKIFDGLSNVNSGSVFGKLLTLLPLLLPLLLAGATGLGATVLAALTTGIPILAGALGAALLAYLAGKTKTGKDVMERAAAALGFEGAEKAVQTADQADDAARYKDRKEDPNWYSNDGVYRFARKIGLKSWVSDPNAPKDGVAGKAGAGMSGADGAPSGIKRVVEAGAGYNVVERNDGSIVKQKGNWNWRNNNMGNIEAGKFADQFGAIKPEKSTGKGASRFAVFPSYEAGRAAQESLLFESGKYKDLDLMGAIARYAPPRNKQGGFENDTALYQRTVLNAVGSNKKMSQYTPAERKAIQTSMEKHEGYGSGRKDVEVLRAATKPELVAKPSKTDAPPSAMVADARVPVAKPTKAAGEVAKATQAPAAVAATKPAPAPKKTAMPPVPAVKEKVSSMTAQNTPAPQQSDTIAQNVGDRDIAHSATGGLGGRGYYG